MSSLRPYYRRRQPPAQQESDFLRDFSLRWTIKRLGAQGAIIPFDLISLRAMSLLFRPDIPGSGRISVREMLTKMLRRGGVAPYVNLLPCEPHELGQLGALAEADRLREIRAAAAVFSTVSPHLGVFVVPNIKWQLFGLPGRQQYWPYRVDDITGAVNPVPDKDLYSPRELLEMKFYGDLWYGLLAPTVYHPTFKSLAAMAYGDYFPGPRAATLRDQVVQALRLAGPGWCGTFGPGIGTLNLAFGKNNPEGNYDMTEQHLLRIAYAYFNELPDDARERVIVLLLARGRIARVNEDDTFTAGRVPNDWARAGFVSPMGAHKRIGETENHILMIATARYLTNQLLYQRNRSVDFDNRRNGGSDAPSCMDHLLYLLRNILRDDFSEYNAKSYQHETRTALLNLCSFAYDAEVRIAARMVLDYVCAHMAVSSNDCRRMVPFRRRNEGVNVRRAREGFMTVSLLDTPGGADPMTEHMAVQSGALRAHEAPAEPWRPLNWSIGGEGGDAAFEMLSDYRMPALIQDLFVTDQHRRFFQILSRRTLDDPDITGRNATTREVNASSPSYLLTAGGHPDTYAIDPRFAGYPVGADRDQQLGVALPSSFMPTSGASTNLHGKPSSPGALQSWAEDLIQIGVFAQEGNIRNYGVAPDLLFGPFLHLPAWCTDAMKAKDRIGKFDFVDKHGPDGNPGFYLAILQDGDLAIVEAFDTWLDPSVEFDTFRNKVSSLNQGLTDQGLTGAAPGSVDTDYVTQAGHRVSIQMWAANGQSAADANAIVYGGAHPTDQLPPGSSSGDFLRGAILNGTGDGFVRIDNPFLGEWIELDMRDAAHPRRRSETGEIEAAGHNEEVWVDFEWLETKGPLPSEGDFFRPFYTLADGRAAVADHGTIRIVPGATAERGSLSLGKRFTIKAPVGGVRIGSLVA